MAKKKSFITDNETAGAIAAERFFTPFGFPMYGTEAEERRTQRVQLLLKPSVYEDLKKIATIQRKSVNALVNEVLEAYRTASEADIERYNETFESEGAGDEQ